MEFKQLVDTAEKWCSGNPFDLIFAEEIDERRLDFYAEPGISFYVLCPDNMNGGTDNFVSMTKLDMRVFASVCDGKGVLTCRAWILGPKDPIRCANGSICFMANVMMSYIG